MALLSALVLGAASGVLSARGDTRPPACPDNIPPASFGDIGHLPDETASAIACILHYGITSGTSPTAYSPGAPVSRSQTARFLVRTAAGLGMELPEVPADPASQFEDLGTMDADGRRSIHRLLELGVTRGVSASEFGPQTPVSRRQMALFLARLLRAAEVPAAQPPEDPGAPPFTDLDGLPPEVVEAVGYLDGLGVEWGAPPASGSSEAAPQPFRPDLQVTREEMARLLAASLEAGGARPVRLKIELSASRAPTSGAVEAEVTVTKPSGDPYPGLLVDVFVSQDLLPGGGCQVDNDARVNGGDGGTSDDCRIDRADPRTDSMGRVRIGLAHSPIAETDRIYAWTGLMGQEYREAVPDQVWAELTWFSGPNRVEVDEPEEAEFGEVVTIRARLVGAGARGERMVMVVTRQSAPVYTRAASASFDGGVRFSYRGPPDPSATNEDLELVETIKVFWDRNRNGVHDGPAELFAETTMIWDD